MSFCSECGTQIDVGALFCPECGTPAEPGPLVAPKQISPTNSSGELGIFQKVKSVFGTDSRLYYGVLALLVAQSVLGFVPTFGAGYPDLSGSFEGYSVAESIGAGPLVVTAVLAVILATGGLLLMVIPVLIGRPMSPNTFILAQVSLFYSIVGFVLMALGMVLGNRHQGYYFRPTFWGFIYIIVSGTLMIAIFKLAAVFPSRKPIKQAKKDRGTSGWPNSAHTAAMRFH